VQETAWVNKGKSIMELLAAVAALILIACGLAVLRGKKIQGTQKVRTIKLSE
jgi:hypothetical protein